jgi:Na+/H+ antiporter NhaD/arsenite permease-like protein
MIGVAVATVMVVALSAQAMFASRRLVIVLSGAAATALLVHAGGRSSLGTLLAELPWDVLVLLVTLGLTSEVFARTHAFEWLAVRLAAMGRGDPRRVVPLTAVAMWAVSALVNNLTALLLVLPVVHALLAVMGATRNVGRWTLGTLLVACNLGGAATPIGDFPALLLLGSGVMTFSRYLILAAPATAIALMAVLFVASWNLRGAEAPHAPITRRLTVSTVRALHRGLRVDRRRLVLATGILGGMLWAWLARPMAIEPALVAWLGAAALLLCVGPTGEDLARTRVDAEAVLFLASLFVMVGAVRASGLFEALAQVLRSADLPPEAKLVVFLSVSAMSTALFSAGPSMAAMLEVAPALDASIPPEAVYVGLALSVCAGSSVFLTAATSGPLAQALTERARIRVEDGGTLVFGFKEHLLVGVPAFLIIGGTAIGWALALAA